MRKIFFLMGKTASGKTTVYKRLLKECPGLSPVATYTTRPMWDGEVDGVDDGVADTPGDGFLVIGMLESYKKVKGYFGEDAVVPIYIVADDGVRLEHSLAREHGRKEPHYAEVCRRFLSDEQDFSPENLEKHKIMEAYQNTDIEKCVDAIKKVIQENS